MKIFFILLVLLFLIKAGTYHALEKAVTYRNQRAVVLKKDLERKAEHVQEKGGRIYYIADDFPQMWFPSKEYRDIKGFISDFEEINSYDSLLVFIDNHAQSSGFDVERLVYEKLPAAARSLALKYDFLDFLVQQQVEKDKGKWTEKSIIPILFSSSLVGSDSLRVEMDLYHSYQLTSYVHVRANGKMLPLKKLPFYCKESPVFISIVKVDSITKKASRYERRF